MSIFSSVSNFDLKGMSTMLRNVSGKRPAVSNLSGEPDYKRQNTGKTDEETSPLFHSIDMLTNPENKTVKCSLLADNVL